METENNTNKEQLNQVDAPKGKLKGKVMTFIIKNIVAVILVVVLVVVYIWLSVKISVNTKHYETEKTLIITKYETEKDSLQIKGLEFASTIFSWSVRSELLRDNKENLNQLLTTFVKESDADLVQLVSPDDKQILLSSDKKYEGTQYTKEINFEINEPVVMKDDQGVSILIPVMGFSNRIGVLVVEVRKR